jgi:hypothetical protein
VGGVVTKQLQRGKHGLEFSDMDEDMYEFIIVNFGFGMSLGGSSHPYYARKSLTFAEVLETLTSELEIEYFQRNGWQNLNVECALWDFHRY